MTTPRNSHTLTLLLDGRVLAVGGWDGASPLASAELYDPAAGAWRPASPLSVARVFPTASLLPDGRVLVVGGWNTLGVALTGTEVYDPGANAWRPGPALRTGRAGHTATRLSDDRVLVAGGYSEGGLEAAAELYDPVKDAWLPAGSQGAARAHHTVTLLPDGRVLVVGGWDSANRPLASAELYDPTRDAWTPAAELVTARLDHSATLLPDGTVLVVGGWDGRYLANAEVYDPARDAWTPAGSLGAGRAYHTAVLLADGRAAVLGGSDGERASEGVELYDPRTRGWSVAGRLGRAYASQQALVLRDGKVLITGRPDSGDLTGNDGYPTPTPTPTPGPHTPGALDWLLTPRPTATPGARQGNSADTATAFRAAEQAGVAAAAATIPNFSGHFDDTALYGAHEISFTLPALPAGSNPYDISNTHYITFTPQTAPSDYKKVMAFYNGPQGNRDIWTARVYVNHVGQWTWTLPAGAWDFFTGQPFTTTTFTAVERPESGLRGMLRVTSGISGGGKRWYTDDGRTFVPMADTAYRLFFEGPTVTPTPPPNTPISDPCPPVRDLAAFVRSYVGDVMSHGINVIRVEALGNWAYQNTYYYPNTKAGGTPRPYRSESCEPDLSLFWGQAKDTGDALFDGPPDIGQLSGTPTPSVTPVVFYPNLVSFRRTDDALRQLLDENPSLYVQMMLVPEPKDGDQTWLGINPTYRTQLWQTMVARWAAFPNVFWSISNDLGDALPSYRNNVDLAKEVGNYFAANDPWFKDPGGHPIRPMGHFRWKIDSYSGEPWHTFITAYTSADISAEEMDGTPGLPEATPRPYVATPKPVFNVEDQYEEDYGDGKEVTNPDYFYRRLFWSYLLSGSGATYGGVTWPATTKYSTATYTANDCQDLPNQTCKLKGLDNIRYISDTLAAARVDLALFKPSDVLIATPTGTPAWAELNRAQVASRDKQEILAYIPNPTTLPTPTPPPSKPTQVPVDNEARRRVAVGNTSPAVIVDMSTFTDPNYAVTWYNPTTGISLTAPAISGTSSSVSLSAPITFTGDAVLHISSRCTDPNKCQPMDANVSFGGSSDFEGFQINVVTATIHTDSDQRIFGNSWRCVGEGCTIGYSFPATQTIASADVYFRRNAPGAEFGTNLHESNPISGTLFEPDFIVTHVFPSGALETVTSAMGSGGSLYLEGAAPALNRWYHLATRAERDSSNAYRVKVSLDGALIFDSPLPGFATGDPQFDSVTVGASGSPGSSVWLDELSVDPATPTEIHGLLRAFLQQGLGDYSGATAAYFDGSGGYNNTALLHVGANNVTKGLLRFDVSNIPTAAVIDEAILQLYNTGRSNGNTLTLGAHGVLADWIDAEANKTQRKNGVNWAVVGMGSGSDYAAAAAATASLTGAGNAWIDLNITGLAQAWVSDPADNLGLVLTQEAASGYVIYDFCSELGWPPCTAAQAPKLTLRYHLAPPPPVKATFQQGVGGYSGTNATYFDGAAGYNNTSQWHVGQSNSMKALLRFALPTLPITATVDEATLRLYQLSRSNGNTLTLGAHQVLADWVDAQANKTQRQTGLNWAVMGMGSGSDYVAEADGTADLASEGGAWIDLDVKAMTQAWVSHPDDNHGLVLLQEAASGSVYYNFCSELGWSPCTSAQAPKLTIWYH